MLVALSCLAVVTLATGSIRNNPQRLVQTELKAQQLRRRLFLSGLRRRLADSDDKSKTQTTTGNVVVPRMTLWKVNVRNAKRGLQVRQTGDTFIAQWYKKGNFHTESPCDLYQLHKIMEINQNQSAINKIRFKLSGDRMWECTVGQLQDADWFGQIGKITAANGIKAPEMKQQAMVVEKPVEKPVVYEEKFDDAEKFSSADQKTLKGINSFLRVKSKRGPFPTVQQFKDMQLTQGIDSDSTITEEDKAAWKVIKDKYSLWL